MYLIECQVSFLTKARVSGAARRGSETSSRLSMFALRLEALDLLVHVVAKPGLHEHDDDDCEASGLSILHQPCSPAGGVANATHTVVGPLKRRLLHGVHSDTDCCQCEWHSDSGLQADVSLEPRS